MQSKMRNHLQKIQKKLQKYLKLAGFYKSTIDGDFGKGTRAAISNWQKSIDKEGTGYLTKKQIKLLKRQFGGYLGYNYPKEMQNLINMGFIIIRFEVSHKH